MKKREAWLDVAKAIAIIFVVLGHVPTSYRNSGLLQDAFLMNYSFKLAYSFHMPLFFAIAGYLSSKTEIGENFKQKIVDKLIAYGIPYVVFSVLQFFLKVAGTAFVNSKVNFLDVLQIPFYPMGVLWYIYALMLFSVIQILVRRIFGNGKKVLNVCIIVALLARIGILLFEKSAVYENHILQGSILINACKNYIYYVLGERFFKTFAEKAKNVSDIKGKRILWLLVSTLCYLCLVHIIDIYDILFGTMLAVAGIVLFSAWGVCLKNSKFLEKLGKDTFPIYLLHGYVISFVRVLLSKLHVPLLYGAVPILACTVFGILLPLITYNVCKRFNVTDFMFYPKKYMKSRDKQ